MKIGLTWAPSSGKSSLVTELGKRGFRIFPEAATEIIEAEKKKGREVSDIVNDDDFQERIHALKLLQYKKYRKESRAVFDTTFVDDVAHRRATGVDIRPILKTVNNKRYDIVFFLEHPGYVEENGIRMENHEEAMRLDALKRNALEEFWYDLVGDDYGAIDYNGTQAVILPAYADIVSVSERIRRRASAIERLTARR